MPGEIGPQLGAGNGADVYEYGAAAIKLYRDGAGRRQAFIEAAVLAIVADHDLPTPRVHQAGEFEGRWGLVMDRARGKPLASFTRGQPELVPEVIDEIVRLHLRMHERAEPRLPTLKARLKTRIAAAPLLTEERRGQLMAQLAGLPDGDRLCHGDFHPFNIIGLPGQLMVIDWLDATSGAPAADVCRSFLLMMSVVPELAENYVDLYAARSGLSRAEILAWLPFLAAARLTEGVTDEQEMLLRLAG